MPEQQCDGFEDCWNGVDESNCPQKGRTYINNSVAPPAVITFSFTGKFTVKHLEDCGRLSPSVNQSQPCRSPAAPCPNTHFPCSRDGVVIYCLPVYVRCNDVSDCVGEVDEVNCEDYTCPGFYRCRGSRVCVHVDHVCDGVRQCPQRDDELVCGAVCPEGCTCYGLAFFCRRVISFLRHLILQSFLDLRYLDVSGSTMTTKDIGNVSMLVHLGMARCRLVHIQLPDLPNLISLDLGMGFSED